MPLPILFVHTSADKLLNGAATGWYLPESAHAALAIAKAGISIDFASPAGGEAPLDQVSVDNFKDDESVTFLNSTEWQAKYKNTKKLADVKAEDYSAIYVVGGHGPMIDLAQSDSFAKLLEDFYNAKKPVSAVCHGPAALVKAQTNGQSILKGIKVTGFANSEEAQTPYNDFVNILPFSLEDKLNELSEGGYVKASEDWGVKVVWDGGVLTGQNPASAKAMGEKLVQLVSK